MNRKDIKEFINYNFKKIDGNLRLKLLSKYSDIYESIYIETSYLVNSSFSERLYHIMKDLYDIQKCKYCEIKLVNFLGFNRGYSIFCSQKCMANSEDIKSKRRNTCLERYGVDIPLKSTQIVNKMKNTCLEKYGKESYFQTEEFWDIYKNKCLETYGFESHNQSDEVKNKKIQSCLDNYGVSNPSKSEEIKIKKLRTCLENFGVSSPLKSKEILNKYRNTCIRKYNKDNVRKVESIVEKGKETCVRKYGVDHYCKTDEYKKFKRKKFLNNEFKKCLKIKQLKFLDNEFISSNYEHNWKCLLCETIFKARYNTLRDGLRSCPGCFPKCTSKVEKDIEELISKEYNHKIIMNDRNIIKPYELDLFFPTDKFAIEFNGLYWHSTKYIPNRNYHLMKTNLCKNKGIRLIHIFEDEWFNKNKIVISLLRSILNLDNKEKIHVDECLIKEIDSPIKNKFLDNFHIQGEDNSNVKIGAFYNDELVSIMTFSNSNISKGFYKQNKVWELSRFATNYDYQIPGIYDELLRSFKSNYEWNKIVTYIDKRWSYGELCNKLGFVHEYDKKPTYWYVNGYQRIHKSLLRKTNEDPKDIPEKLFRQSQGYNIVWDCGTMKFSMVNGAN